MLAWPAKLKQFYFTFAENKTQFYLFLGFLIIPVVGMTLFYLYVRIYWL